MQKYQVTDDDVDKCITLFSNEKVRSLLRHNTSQIKTWLRTIVDNSEYIDQEDTRKENVKLYEKMVLILGHRVKSWMSWLSSSEVGSIVRHIASGVASFGKQIVRQHSHFADLRA